MQIRNGSLSHLILSGLKSAADNGLLEIFSYSAQMKYLRSQSGISPKRQQYLGREIERLIVRGLLEYEISKDGDRILKLTSASLDHLGKGAWDGKYRVVIWDIPERKRRLRDLLRRKLKTWDFVNIQKSVWVSKLNITLPLRELIVDLEMEQWVTVIETDDKVLSAIKFHDRG